MLFKEIRHALRMFAKNPAFTLVAALSVALGIGVNCALFSFHDAILLRPLPVPEPDSVVSVTASSSDDPSFAARLSYPNYRDLREKIAIVRWIGREPVDALQLCAVAAGYS